MLLASALAGCATLPEAPPRLAASPLGCIRATVAAKVPRDVGDKLQHCLAGGLIARHCSVTEARLASWGKEVGDALGRGDADRADLDADFAGIGCARTARDDTDVRRCCEARYPPADAAPAQAQPRAQAQEQAQPRAQGQGQGQAQAKAQATPTALVTATTSSNRNPLVIGR